MTRFVHVPVEGEGQRPHPDVAHPCLEGPGQTTGVDQYGLLASHLLRVHDDLRDIFCSGRGGVLVLRVQDAEDLARGGIA